MAAQASDKKPQATTNLPRVMGALNAPRARVMVAVSKGDGDNVITIQFSHQLFAEAYERYLKKQVDFNKDNKCELKPDKKVSLKIPADLTSSTWTRWGLDLKFRDNAAAKDWEQKAALWVPVPNGDPTERELKRSWDHDELRTRLEDSRPTEGRIVEPVRIARDSLKRLP